MMQTIKARHSIKRCLQWPLMLLLTLFFISMSACSPTVKVAAPSEPITINLNVKIEHEIKVKVDKELDELFDENSKIF